jgi:hypothetical protein
MGWISASPYAAVPRAASVVVWAILIVVLVLAFIWTYRWRRSPPIVRATPLILALPASAAGVAALWALSPSWPRADKLALLTLIAGVLALVLAGAAAVIAAATYRQSVEAPDLVAQLYCHVYPPNQAILLADEVVRVENSVGNKRGWMEVRELRASEQADLQVRVVVGNRGKVTATHVAVRVVLICLGALNEAQRSWEPLPTAFWKLNPFENEFGSTAAIWEGGGDEVVHANWSRVLPPISLAGVKVLHDFDKASGVSLIGPGFAQIPLQPALIVEVVTDGVTGPVVRLEVPVEVYTTAETQNQRLLEVMTQARQDGVA